MSELVLCESRNSVAILTLNRPEKLNALNYALVDLLKLATGANLAPMVNFLTTVTDIVQWATALSGSNVGSALTYDLGSFKQPTDTTAVPKGYEFRAFAWASTDGLRSSVFAVKA